MADSDWSLGNSVDWGGVSGDDGLGGVGLDGGVVDVGGLNNLNRQVVKTKSNVV